MALTINTNRSASIANRALTETTRAMDRALAKLSSGQRVESARDDAASLAISSRLNVERQSLMAYRQNATQAVSLLQVAEGSYQRVENMLTRMRALATQAQGRNLSNVERGMLDTEYQQLKSEISRMASSTTFGGQQLFAAGGSFSSTLASGSFSTTNVFTTIVGDFNGDGIDDNVIGSAVGSNSVVTVITNNMDGTMTNSQTISWAATGFGTTWTATGDVDGDGDLDIIAASNQGNAIEFLVNNGSGSFTRQSSGISLAGGAITHMVSGDFNNDGRDDVAFSQASGNNLTIVTMGAGLSATSSTINVGASINNALLAVGDLNNDGNLDITSNYNTRLTVLGNGNGSFGSAISSGLGFEFSDSYLYDVNNDGLLDAISFTWSGTGISIGINNGNGTFTDNNIAGVFANGISQMRVGDFNGDGIMDIYGRRQAGGEIYLAIGTGSLTFAPSQTMANFGIAGNTFVTGDFNRDGVTDLSSLGTGSLQRIFYVNQTGNGMSGTTRVSSDSASSNNINWRIGGISLNALSDGLHSSRIGTIGAAISAEDEINTGLRNLSRFRTNVGAAINRIEAAARNIETMLESTENARSAYADLDVAQEMSKFIALQLTQQAGISMLAQANQTQGLLLRLIQGN